LLLKLVLRRVLTATQLLFFAINKHQRLLIQ